VRRRLPFVDGRALALSLCAIPGDGIGKEVVPEGIRVLDAVARVAPSDSPVLISGESGTGKELVAHMLHRLSGRNGPFVDVSCAALTEGLLESELFGHERNAFPGADERKLGLMELAAGGTLFLDEISELSSKLQGKLLRALDGLELSRDLLASVRDFHQSKIANDQNEVMKVLTVIASLLLLPTFIVGVYGQNFVNIPELHWQWGYGYVWGVIVATTIAQLWFFKSKDWI